MDPLPFIRLIVESLALKLPPATPRHTGGAGSGVHPSSPATTPYFCSIKLHHHFTAQPTCVQQTTPLPLFPEPPTALSSSTSTGSASAPVLFHIDPSALQYGSKKPASLAIAVYSGSRSSGGGGTTSALAVAAACGLGCGGAAGRRSLGRARVTVDLSLEEVLRTPAVYFSGWVAIGGGKAAGGGADSVAKLHVVVRSEPDPRYVFQFGGEPECSPVVYQIGGGAGARGAGESGGGAAGRGQPVFSCRFTAERRASTGSSFFTDDSGASTPVLSRPQWLRTLSSGGGGGGGGVGDHHHHHHQHSILPRRPPQSPRKGWTVTIHDLSGSPVAAASMITPFCPSPTSGSPDRVSRTSPGAWLVLQPVPSSFGGSGGTSWKPWGRLEAWRERGASVPGGGDALGYRFELVGAEPGDPAVRLAEAEIGMRRGGEFRIDIGGVGGAVGGAASVAAGAGGGFVMAAKVEGECKVSRPRVEVGMQHVRCAADAALFVALAAAVDLSIDACGLFSMKLKKELCNDRQEK